MAIESAEITPEQVQRIIDLEEGHFGDLKRIEVSPATLTKSIAAFANADGGELYIGIDENDVDGIKTRSWRGFATEEDANGHLQAFEQLFPLGQDFSYQFLRADGQPGTVLRVEVQKTSDIKTASDGAAYLRRGAQKLPVPEGEPLERLKRNKGITSFENSTVDGPVEAITDSYAVTEFMVEVVPTSEAEPWLRKQLLIASDKPTVAGVLLFADEPQALLPKRSAIKIYRYKTTDPEGSRETLAFDPLTIEGNLYEQIHRAVETTVGLIEEVTHIGPTGFEKVEYPFETLHEIITNAVLHRDYSHADDVHVRIFDNRVEVESPGRLPAHVTVENILDERFARNGKLVRLINKFPDPPNKDVGEGLNTAFSAMKQLKLKDPQIVELDNSVVVNIRHEPLASPEEMVMTYLDNNEEITNSIVRSLTGIGSENKVKRIFEKLMGVNEIERVPGKQGYRAAYRKKSDTEIR
jgi:ATP-dependent DNA helicase RecG